MLNQEEKVALVQMAMDAEECSYCNSMMNFIVNLIGKKQSRDEIMQFLYSVQGSPLRLFFEIMRYLPSVSNEKELSYKL